MMRWCNCACNRVAKGRFAALSASAAAVLTGATGCISASLATSTGVAPPNATWSNERYQSAHVGESVKFDFVLTDAFGRPIDPVGIADYSAAYVGDERIEVEPHPAGSFRFQHTLTAPPGTDVDVEVTAYRQRAGRDFAKIGERWVATASPYAQPDRKMARDVVTLNVYQVEVALRIPRPADDLEPESGVLRIVRDDGHVTTVYIDRPNRPGFVVTGPEPDGYYTVTYAPTADMVNRHGTTRVEFQIHDLAGHRHEHVKMIETP